MIFILSIGLTFLLGIAAIRLHHGYITAEIYYNSKLLSIQHSSAELESAVGELLSISRTFKEDKTRTEIPCGKNPNENCVLCDKECVVRRNNLNE